MPLHRTLYATFVPLLARPLISRVSRRTHLRLLLSRTSISMESDGNADTDSILRNSSKMAGTLGADGEHEEGNHRRAAYSRTTASSMLPTRTKFSVRTGVQLGTARGIRTRLISWSWKRILPCGPAMPVRARRPRHHAHGARVQRLNPSSPCGVTR